MTYKVAILGAGIGAQHLDAFLALPNLFEPVLVCDLNLDRAHSVADPFGVAVTSDLETVLSREDIDMVDICLPPHLHLAATLAALDAGKSVICEKPLVTSLADCDRLAAKAKSAGRHVFPVFQYRFGQGMAQLLHLVERGLAGRCYAGSLETHWNRGTEYYAVDWRGTWSGEQGGALLGHAIHIHDLISAILGPIARVHAETATLVNEIETEDCAALTLRTETNALITSSVTLGAADNTSRLRLAFEGFTVESDHTPYAPATKPWRFTAREPTSQTEIDRALEETPAVPPAFQGLFSEIAKALDGKPSKAVTLEDGRRSVELVTAAYHSARTGMPVTLPLGANHPLYDGWQPS